MTTATTTGQRGPVRAAYTSKHAEGRIRCDLGLMGITRADVAMTRCDDLLNVYAARVRVSLGPTYGHPTINAVYLYWRDRRGEEHFRTIVHPRDVGNENIDVISVQTDGMEIVVSYMEHCGPGALKNNALERRIRIAELDL
ncbi:hypothetical protein HY635_01810 [Candidatus Uhrbacteria bacterium]|nr:hypothetical protein [Candidatus Uhrbacteria bacterium]